MPVLSASNPGLQANAFTALNDYQNLAQTIWGILQVITDLKQRESTHGYSTIYSNTATYSTNADGSPGTQDGTPNPAHPMIGTYLSSNDIQGFSGYVVNDLYNFLTGISGPTTADRRPAIKGLLP